MPFFLYVCTKKRLLTSAAAFGGVLHVVSTALLGITAVTMANTIAGEETVHKLALLLQIFHGESYILLFALGKGGHSHAHNHPIEKMAVVVGLVLVPGLSPCATTLPVFLAVGNSSSMMILAIIMLLFRSSPSFTPLFFLLCYNKVWKLEVQSLESQSCES